MKYCMDKVVFAIIALLFFCTSCGDTDLFDTDKWSDKVEGLEPNVSVSVVKGSFTLWDLINQKDDSVIIKEGNELAIQYEKRDIYKIKVSDIFEMDPETVGFDISYEISDGEIEIGVSTPKPLDIDIPSSTEYIPNIPDGCDIKKMQASAKLQLPDLGFLYTVRNVSANGAMLVQDRNIPVGGAQVELPDFTLEFAESGKIVLEVALTIPQGTTLHSKTLQLGLALENLTFAKVEGKIAESTFDITGDPLDLDVDFLNEIGGNFKFTQPELTIRMRNRGVGVPIDVDASFVGKNGDRTVTLKKTQGDLHANGNKTNVAVIEEMSLNAENSNIVAFLSLPPQGDITYSGTVYVNKGGLAVDNVIYNNGDSITLDAYVRVPFSLSADSLAYRDTLSDIDIDQKWANRIKTGRLRINADNGLPLNLRIPELVLLDDNNQAIDTVKSSGVDNIIKAAAEKSSLEFELTQEQAKNLGRTKNILLLAVADTNDKDGTGVSIPADAKLEFSLLVEAQVVIDDISDF